MPPLRAVEVDGVNYLLQVDFGPAAFVPPAGGFYETSSGGIPASGYGWWTALIPVPEPSSLVMAATGALLLTCWRRRSGME